jgi:hypothetical protein
MRYHGYWMCRSSKASGREIFGVYVAILKQVVVEYPKCECEGILKQVVTEYPKCQYVGILN